ncbi:KH domain-containing protein HEN4-like isoform X1 [Juglans microcarpa x Juglans regia]|uniref:KH domain-containing protein HEN4-like isoform X1 n=1 Tax=Juglans microcarpa x Juglans regia TaxID=2249226 RepID=UPI001B7E3425|nr:KH domain-containing protein HEN4-like isoform X1 [Juglans microcarpa x Juglans regia]
MGSTYLSPPGKRPNSTLYSSTTPSMPDSYPIPSNGSSKRSKHPPPPLSIPPGHVPFRLLCHASRIGGIIGKSGSVIKTLQQSTGAKIRIEDAPSDSPDRVILVIAPGAISAKVTLKNNTGAGKGNEFPNPDSVVEVSKAQDALLKVFERILEVAAESDGVDVGVGIVSCRLLVEATQVGSVIGKGGKVVEKIRKESGCKIRVLTDKLPACASPSEEMIEVEGNVLAVKKALVAVSRCLQDCPLGDKTRMIGSKPVEAVPRENLPDPHLDHLPQRNPGLYTTPSSSINYASGVHPMSIEIERVPAIETRTLQQDVIFKILCSNDRVGGVIGKGGAIVRALQNETGATICVGASITECDERLITITASENPESRYSPAQKAVVLVFSRCVEAGIEKGQDSGSNKGSPVAARLVVPSNQVGCLLGKGGAIISEMRKVTGAGIRIIGGEQVPKCVSENDQVVQILGEFSNVQDALYNVTGRLRDNLFSSTQNNVGARSSSSVLTDSSPYGRMRDPGPLGSHPSVGVSHSLGRHATLTQSTDPSVGARSSSSVLTDTSPYGRLRDPGPLGSHPSVGVSHGLGRHATLTQSTDPSVGLSQHATLSQSMDHYAITHGLDRPSSPRSWTSQSAVGVNPRSITDVGRGLTSLKGGLELSSGSKSAIVTNTTVEIIVPDNVISSVYGKNGSNLARLRQISGAKVIVHEPLSGSSDRIVVISGTPDETQAAQSLLHAFILTGSS